MSRRFDVYGLGNAIMDLQVRASEADISGLKLEKGAMKLVEPSEQLAVLEHLRTSKSLPKPHQASGGSAANTMIAVSQLGGKVAYGCRVGDDTFGKFYLAEMNDIGVQIDSAPVQGVPTGTCVILITPDAERTMNTHLGASSALDASDVNEAILSDSEWVYIEGYLFSSPSGQRVAKRAVELAKKHGTKIAVTCSDGFIVDVFGETLREVVAQSDLVFANLNEAGRFTKQTGDDAIFAALRKAAPCVVMTMSERGAMVGDSSGVVFIQPTPTTAVDDTGAGDMFAGAFLYGLTHGMSTSEAGQLSCYLASRVVSQLGPRLHGDVRGVLASGEFRRPAA